MSTSATPLLTAFARPDHALLAHAQLTLSHLIVRRFSWSGLRTERIALSMLQGVEYFCESPRETGLTLYMDDGTSFTLRLKAARLWLLTLTDAAPQLEQQGAIDPVHFDEPLPAVPAPAASLPSPTPEPLGDGAATAARPLAVLDPIVAPDPALAHEPKEGAPPTTPRDVPEFILGEGWTADRMTRTLNQLSDAETDRRSQALLRSLDWADA
ncbi:MAG: hypothetical protein AAGJ10_04070 [Bacteroidota bacterium]